MSNTGDRNTGHNNIGDWNTGNNNIGDWNTGHNNIGDRNTGHNNIGDWNTGNRNTGDRNIGDGNTGIRNTGDGNIGNWNTGDGNTGNWNVVDRATGYFNTTKTKCIRVFNTDCEIDVWENTVKPSFLFFRLTEWIDSTDMTNEEKEANPSYKTTGGYLKSYEYKEAFQNSYKRASKKDKELLLELPNFDADVFFEISGIDVRKKDNTDQIKAIEDKIKELQAEVEKLK